MIERAIFSLLSLALYRVNGGVKKHLLFFNYHSVDRIHTKTIKVYKRLGPDPVDRD